MNQAVVRPIKVGEIFEEAQRLAMAALPSLIVYLTVLTLGGMYVDQTVEFEGPNLLLNLMSIALMYWFVISMIQQGGLAPDGLAAGFGTYFGLSLLSGIGMLLGLVVFIIPGVILAIRWAPLYGYGLVEDGDISRSFGRSWDATGEHFFPILLAMCVPAALYGLGFAIFFSSVDDYGMVGYFPSAIFNLLLWMGAALIGAIGIAVYSLLRDGTSQLTEVFE